jgi:hypothetical protein
MIPPLFGKQEVGIWRVKKRFYTHWTDMHIFRHIFLSNYWWQRSDIWSQASYRYPISWEAFLDPSDSYFLFAEERAYHKWALAHSSSCYPQYGIPIWPNIRFLQSTVTEKNATKNILDGQKDRRTEVKQYTPLPLRGAVFSNFNMVFIAIKSRIMVL